MLSRPAPPKLNRRPTAPAGLDDHVSRRDAAQLLGFGSDFRVRQLEKEGRLQPVRGALGQAWYPRTQVMALVDPVAGARRVGRVSGALTVVSSRWSDAALIAHLRAGAQAGAGSPIAGSGQTPAGRAFTVVDLVAETGISIARAERVYRFWATHDAHPVAANLRAVGPAAPVAGPRVAPSPPAPMAASVVSGATPTKERRAPLRVHRDALIERLRDPDPASREAAFRELQELRSATMPPSER